MSHFYCHTFLLSHICIICYAFYFISRIFLSPCLTCVPFCAGVTLFVPLSHFLCRCPVFLRLSRFYFWHYQWINITIYCVFNGFNSWSVHQNNFLFLYFLIYLWRHYFLSLMGVISSRLIYYFSVRAYITWWKSWDIGWGRLQKSTAAVASLAFIF